MLYRDIVVLCGMASYRDMVMGGAWRKGSCKDSSVGGAWWEGSSM